MSNKLNNQFYFVSPLEVVKVTTDNLEEVAAWCGGKVAQTESRRVKGRIDSYVWVPTPKGTNLSWAFPGMFITKRLVVTLKNELKATFSIFKRDYFEKNYFDTPQAAVDATWERELAEKAKKLHPASQKLSKSIPTPADVERMMGDHGTQEEPEEIDAATINIVKIMDPLIGEELERIIKEEESVSNE